MVVLRPHVAAADPALLEHGDAQRAVVLGEVEGRSQAVAAAADNDDVIVALGGGIAPGWAPARMAAQGLAQHRKNRIAIAQAPTAPAARDGENRIGSARPRALCWLTNSDC